MGEYMERFGFYEDPPIDYPGRADGRRAATYGRAAGCCSPTSRRSRRRPHGDRPGRAARSRRCRWRRSPQTVANGGVRMEPRIVDAGRRPRRAHDRRDRARGGRARDVRARPRAELTGDDAATSSRRAPAPPRRSRASRSRARPAPPRSTSATASTSRGSSASRRPTARASRSTIERDQGGTGGDDRRADRQGGDGGAGRVTEPTARARHVVDGRYRIARAARLGRDGRRLLRRGPAARPPGRAEAAPPPLRRGRRVRRALPPRGVERGRASSTRTSSRSTTAASGTAPTTSRWSSSTAAR